ncbi:MAG: hypothetical protein P1U74_02570 [Legionellaceae bacterium]|nr:hypothetical protein [Legionellaceae bacterium]
MLLVDGNNSLKFLLDDIMTPLKEATLGQDPTYKYFCLMVIESNFNDVVLKDKENDLGGVTLFHIIEIHFAAR